jgi:sortase A
MLSRILGAVGRTLITSGTLILLFVAYQLWGTGLQEAKSQRALSDQFEQLQQQFAARTSTTTSTTTTTAQPGTTATTLPPLATEPARDDLPLPKPGDPIAKIRIPKIGITRTVVEGVDLSQLKRGPGHYPETPLPGQRGNVAIAGHRTTYGQPFHNVDKLAPGDDILFETLQGNFRYVVDEIKIVKPSQVEVLLPRLDANGVLENRITLIACQPKYSAAKRIIISGVLKGPPANDLKGQDVARRKAIEARGGDDPLAKASIDGGLSGIRESKAPTIVWGLVCALIWFVTWLVQVFLRRRMRRAAREAEATPTRRQRLLTWSPYLVGVPVFLVALYVFFENFGRLLPGNY